MKNSKTLFVAQSGLIAALYVVLTWVSNLVGLSYGSIQFRISEVLTILPVFTPAAIPGLTIGCLLANLSSPYGILDIAFGTLATLCASLLSYLFKDIRFKKLPLLSAFMPVIFNAIAVATIIGIFVEDKSQSFFSIFIISFLEVGLGELVTGFVGGLALAKLLEKNQFKKIINNDNIQK